MRTYAGIGSRRAPDHVLGLCRRIAEGMHALGWVLRSGHAIGCDQAFEMGAGDHAQVFLPWKDFEQDGFPILGQAYTIPSMRALEMVQELHPAPHRLSMAGCRLHARNCHILLGPALDDPVNRVICWTADESRGGTSFGIRLARELGIPVHNLADERSRAAYLAMCDGRNPSSPPWPNPR